MKPVVGIVADREQKDGVDRDLIRIRYLEALLEGAGVVPLIIPTDLDSLQLSSILERVDGLVLGGSETNVHPTRYCQTSDSVGFLVDPARDKTVFGAIDLALQNNMPILGICRGLQELNVALGGALDPNTSSGEGRLRHFEDTSLPRNAQYLPAHQVRISEQGEISRCVKNLGATCAQVNSLHRQAISRLGDGLTVDLKTDDGVIEAISKTDQGTFVAAVQWHPEWYFKEDPLSRQIFARFGDACRAYASNDDAPIADLNYIASSSGYNVRKPHLRGQRRERCAVEAV